MIKINKLHLSNLDNWNHIRCTFYLQLFLKGYFFFYTVLLNTDNFFDSSIWSIDGAKINMTTPGHSGPESNDNEGVFHTSQIWILTIRYSLVSYLGHPFFLGGGS